MKDFFKALFKRTGTVTVNGTRYSGNSVVISGSVVAGNVVGGDLIIDGVRQASAISLSAPMNITVNGDVERLETASGKVEVAGSCGSVKTMSGGVTCGAVSGDVGTMSGDVKCGDVTGKVKTMSGDITMRR
jgi:hypothetical protein